MDSCRTWAVGDHSAHDASVPGFGVLVGFEVGEVSLALLKASGRTAKRVIRFSTRCDEPHPKTPFRSAVPRADRDAYENSQAVSRCRGTIDRDGARSRKLLGVLPLPSCMRCLSSSRTVEVTNN